MHPFIKRPSLLSNLLKKKEKPFTVYPSSETFSSKAKKTVSKKGKGCVNFHSIVAFSQSSWHEIVLSLQL